MKIVPKLVKMSLSYGWLKNLNFSPNDHIWSKLRAFLKPKLLLLQYHNQNSDYLFWEYIYVKNSFGKISLQNSGASDGNCRFSGTEVGYLNVYSSNKLLVLLLLYRDTTFGVCLTKRCTPIKNNTQTVVTNMTIKSMLENKII